jgi:hypothetical protein
MIAALSRAVMALAVSCLDDDRREWALAMEAEFEAAKEDGKPLAFAFGCLVAAWRELPAHEEGRFTIASHVLAFVLILPTAALLAGMAADFPAARSGAPGLLEAIGGREPLLSEANRSAVPALAALAALLAAAHLRIAWLVLERDWERMAAVAALAAAATVTLVIFSVVVFDYYGSALGQAAALAVELAAVSALARWHGRSFGEPPKAISGPN